MGSKNADLILACERAHTKFAQTDNPADERDWKDLKKLVEESQKRCPHDGEKHQIVMPANSKTDRWKKGDRITFCKLCSGVIPVLVLGP